MPDTEATPDRSTEEMPTLTPVGASGQSSPQPIIAPPQPAMIGAGFGQQVAQPWAIDRKMFPLNVVQGRATERNVVSEYRKGEITFGPGGVNLQGKAVLGRGIRTTLFIVTMILLRGGGLIIALILEYAVRLDRTDALTWDCIEGVVLEPEKQKVCIAYHLPDKPKTSYGLGLKLEGGLFEEFARTIREYVPERVTIGKVLSPTSVLAWCLLGFFVVLVIGVVILLSINH